MALFTFNFESKYLRGNTELTVILPDRARTVDSAVFYQSDKRYKVLWLLHGTFGDNTDWVRKSMIEQYASELDLIVVMPNSMNSEYQDWPLSMKGYAPRTFFFDELMPMVHAWLPASDKREDNFIAGLSMGGDGALKYALMYPQRFAAVASLSAEPCEWDGVATEDASPETMRKLHLWPGAIQNAGGLQNYLKGPENLWRTLFESGQHVDLPRMYFSCGTKDHGYSNYTAFKAKAMETNLGATFEEFPGYEHEWRVWDLAIQSALRFFRLSTTEA